MSDTFTLSPREVAAAVGLSESSLKRWADRGRLQVTRTEGGHRRITRDEALRFARERGLAILRPEVLGLSTTGVQTADGRIDSLSSLLIEHLSAGRMAEARDLLLAAFAGGTPVADLCDGPMREALAEVGTWWLKDEGNGICVEHAATDLCIQTLNRMRATLQPPPSAPGQGTETRPLALGASPSHDPYTLASLMAATVLAEHGFQELNLGTNTPLIALTHAIERYGPRLVWLASSGEGRHPDPASLMHLSRACDAAGAVLVVGGRGFTDVPELPAPHRVLTSMNELATTARQIRRASGWSRRSARDCDEAALRN